jgi:hypothetical protein
MGTTRNFDEDLKDSNKKELLLDWERYIKKIFGEDVIINWKEKRRMGCLW